MSTTGSSTDDEFDATIRDGGFLEWAVVHSGARYGTPADPVDDALAHGRRALLEIDLQGARQVRAKMPEALLVFLAPPSWEELVRRLVGRGTETAAGAGAADWRPRGSSWRLSGSSTRPSSTPMFIRRPKSW